MSKAFQLPLIIRDRRRRHWHWSPDIIIDLYGVLLGPHGLAIYYALSRYANRETETVTLSVATLAKRTGMSDRQVRRELRKLEEYGLISVVQRGRFSLPNEYTLLDPPEEITFVGRATSETPDRESALADRAGKGDRESAILDTVVGVGKQISIEQQQHISRMPDSESASLVDLMVDFGILRDVALDLAQCASREEVEGWIAYASDPRATLKNPQGFVVDRLGKGEQPPPTKLKPGSKQDRYRYFRGEYADYIEG